MYCFDLKIRHWLALALLLLAHNAGAEHVLGIGAEADSEDSRALSALGSFGIGDNSWLSGAASYNVSRGGFADLETVYFDAGFDHHFDPIGIRVGVGYWGDSELLDSNDARAGIYWKNDKASISLDYERRAFDLTIRSLLQDQARFIEFDADGIGASLRLQLSEAVGVYANGMSYDYSRNISLEPRVDVLRIFALSRLSMVNSLLDDRVSGGIEFNLGEKLFDVRVSSWNTAVFNDRIDSLGVGLLFPVSDSADLELRLSTDDAESAGRATLFSVFLYFYAD